MACLIASVSVRNFGGLGQMSKQFFISIWNAKDGEECKGGLSRELGQQGISWQHRPERRWLGSLLANERAVGPVLRFFGR